MGKARKFSSNDDDSVLQSQSDNENYAVGAQQNAQNLGSVHFSDNSGYGNFQQAGRDQRNASLDGSLFRGNIGFNLQICVLDVGTETIDILDDGSTPLSVISTDKIVSLSAGVTGDLTTILGAQRPGQRLLLYGIQGNTITIKHTAAATPNTILTPGATDFTLADTGVALLVYDISTTKWRVLSGGSGGSGGGGYDTIEDEGVALPQRTTMDFRGDTVTALDDGAETEIRIFSPTWKKSARVVLTGFDFFFPNIQEVEDGVTLVPGDRVLLTAELNPINNGIWEVQAPLIIGVPNQYLLARPLDFLVGDPAYSETFCAIEEGAAGQKKLFHLTSFNPMIIDTDSQTWEEFSSAGGITDPIILNENDIGTIGFANVLIDWSAYNFHRMELNGDITVTMQNLPVSGKWEQVIVEFTQDATGGHTVTFTDTFANGVTPMINPGINSKTTAVFYAYNDGTNVILAFDVNSNFTEFPEFDHGTVGAESINIDWGVSNFQRMVLDGDIFITHTNLPSPGNWQEVVVEFTQDLTGGWITTYTQTFANGVVPLVNLAPTSKTTVVFYAYNTGAITIILAFETQSAGNTNFIHATKVANQIPPLTVGTPATFDSILSNSGITVVAGIFSGFRAGRTYELECSIAILNAVNNLGSLSFQFNDIANATLIGSRGDAILTGQLVGDSAQPVAKAIFQPLLDTDTIEVQFTFNNDLVNTFMYGMGIAGTPQSYVMIKDIT